jgi:hypothetical protein
LNAAAEGARAGIGKGAPHLIEAGHALIARAAVQADQAPAHLAAAGTHQVAKHTVGRLAVATQAFAGIDEAPQPAALVATSRNISTFLGRPSRPPSAPAKRMSQTPQQVRQHLPGGVASSTLASPA